MELIDKIEKEVKEIDKDIEDAKNLLNQSKGREIELLARLKSEFGFNNLDEAKTELNEATEKAIGLDRQITEKFDTLKKEMESRKK